MSERPLILVAVREGPAAESVLEAVRDEGFDALEVSDGLSLLRLVFERAPEAVVLELDRTEMDGLDLLRTLRAASDVPLVALTDAVPERSVGALDSGADDVASRATHPAELAARLRAVLRRRRPTRESHSREGLVRTGDLEIDRQARQVRKGGQPVRLTRMEYRVLDMFASRAGEMIPHRLLLEEVWGERERRDTHCLRLYIGYLRSKLEDEPSEPRYLVNEWGVGYRLALLPHEPGTSGSIGTRETRGQRSRRLR